MPSWDQTCALGSCRISVAAMERVEYLMRTRGIRRGRAVDLLIRAADAEYLDSIVNLLLQEDDAAAHAAGG